ncbi:hypothetical protein QR680_006251 [Steinernema hermaphroditum]|uniref:WD repeat domain phosphoinositide-interacting protein 2 n=1 Tax=Steinernema hermaphroditum TaxID=289476 RepID=A0AA39HUT4_9BILA|nr:hypothetical protein QR680_006251 [Steinernema hermaphroditum]
MLAQLIPRPRIQADEHHVSFNQDATSISYGHNAGVIIYTLNGERIEKQRNYNNDETAIVERLFLHNLIVTVSRHRPNVLRCFTLNGQLIKTITCRNDILAVRLNKKRLVICIERNLYIHDVKNVFKELHQIQGMPPNVQGIIDLCPEETSILAYPVYDGKGVVNIYDADSLQSVISINAHENHIAAVKLNWDGSLVATASERGTVVRVHSVRTGEKLFEFTRGRKNAIIYALAFSMDSRFLASSGSTGTVHLYKLDQPLNANTHCDSLAGEYTNYLYTQAMTIPMMDSVLRPTSIAKCRLPGVSDFENDVALKVVDNHLCVLVATKEGYYYVFRYDPEQPECQLLHQRHISPDAEEFSDAKSSSQRRSERRLSTASSVSNTKTEILEPFEVPDELMEEEPVRKPPMKMHLVVEIENLEAPKAEERERVMGEVTLPVEIRSNAISEDEELKRVPEIPQSLYPKLEPSEDDIIEDSEGSDDSASSSESEEFVPLEATEEDKAELVGSDDTDGEEEASLADMMKPILPRTSLKVDENKKEKDESEKEFLTSEESDSGEEEEEMSESTGTSLPETMPEQPSSNLNDLPAKKEEAKLLGVHPPEALIPTEPKVLTPEIAKPALKSEELKTENSPPASTLTPRFHQPPKTVLFVAEKPIKQAIVEEKVNCFGESLKPDPHTDHNSSERQPKPFASTVPSKPVEAPFSSDFVVKKPEVTMDKPETAEVEEDSEQSPKLEAVKDEAHYIPPPEIAKEPKEVKALSSASTETLGRSVEDVKIPTASAEQAKPLESPSAILTAGFIEKKTEVEPPLEKAPSAQSAPTEPPKSFTAESDLPRRTPLFAAPRTRVGPSIFMPPLNIVPPKSPENPQVINRQSSSTIENNPLGGLSSLNSSKMNTFNESKEAGDKAERTSSLQGVGATPGNASATEKPPEMQNSESSKLKEEKMVEIEKPLEDVPRTYAPTPMKREIDKHPVNTLHETKPLIAEAEEVLNKPARYEMKVELKPYSFTVLKDDKEKTITVSAEREKKTENCPEIQKPPMKSEGPEGSPGSSDLPVPPVPPRSRTSSLQLIAEKNITVSFTQAPSQKHVEVSTPTVLKSTVALEKLKAMSPQKPEEPKGVPTLSTAKAFQPLTPQSKGLSSPRMLFGSSLNSSTSDGLVFRGARSLTKTFDTERPKPELPPLTASLNASASKSSVVTPSKGVTPPPLPRSPLDKSPQKQEESPRSLYKEPTKAPSTSSAPSQPASVPSPIFDPFDIPNFAQNADLPNSSDDEFSDTPPVVDDLTIQISNSSLKPLPSADKPRHKPSYLKPKPLQDSSAESSSLDSESSSDDEILAERKKQKKKDM